MTLTCPLGLLLGMPIYIGKFIRYMDRVRIRAVKTYVMHVFTILTLVTISYYVDKIYSFPKQILKLFGAVDVAMARYYFYHAHACENTYCQVKFRLGDTFEIMSRFDVCYILFIIFSFSFNMRREMTTLPSSRKIFERYHKINTTENILLIGTVGAGKSATINTITAALSGERTYRAPTGSLGESRRRTTTHLIW